MSSLPASVILKHTLLVMSMILASHDIVAEVICKESLDIVSGPLLTIPKEIGSEYEVLIASAMKTGAPILLSDDGSYSWQFAPYQDNESRLLTILSTAYNTTIVWIANRHHPVSPNASLLVQLPVRTLVLRDADGSIAWSPPVIDISTVFMSSTGNLIMSNSHNATIWQSFDNASDVLVPGQMVRTHHSIVSRLSLEDVSEGHYTLHIEPGGAVFYASFDWQQHRVPYVAFTFSGQLTDVFESGQFGIALHSKCNHTTLTYRMDGSGLDLQQEGSTITQQCRGELQGNMAGATHRIDYATRLGGNGFRYLRLMPYGDIVSFLQTNTGLAVDNPFFGSQFLTLCRLPAYCGINSLCSSPNNCTCPAMFEPINRSRARLGCRLVDTLNCSMASHHQFLAIPGLDYYANAYLPSQTVSSPGECQSLCRANCSCTTAFYHNETRKCHLYDQVQTMLPGSDPSITAFLRVAKLPDPSIDQASSRISKKIIIGVTTGIALMVMMLALFVSWIGRRLMKNPKEESDSEEEAFLESLPGLPPRFTYKDLQSATEGFSKKLGTGGSGAVYEGQISDRDHSKQVTKKMAAEQDHSLKVAVKELQLSRFPTIAASGKKQFRAEVAALGSVSHVNLVQLRGFCAEGPHRLLVYEFLENGSLDRWIFHSATSSCLQWEVQYRIAIDTARGLAFLHEGSRDKVLHLDVKPQNILLDVNFRAKIADFGLCKLVERHATRGGSTRRGTGQIISQTVTAMRGTPGYMAPEWFLRLPVTDKSDVFSYGMVLLELVGGRKNLNLAGAISEAEWYFPAWAVQQAENGNLPDVIDKELVQQAVQKQSTSAMCAAMTRLLQVAFWCIQEHAGSRPSMTTVLLMLEEHLQVPNPPLDCTYILRHQYSCPPPFVVSSSTKATTSCMRERASTPVSGFNSLLEPR